MGLRPEMAGYTIMIDAISKNWAGTGLRVGWCVAPPWIAARMKALIGHMGAWAARPEQIATAELLDDPDLLGDYMPDFRRRLRGSLERIERGLQDMKRDGLPVDCLPAAGAIYLSVNLALQGRTTPDGTVLADDEAVRAYLLHEAGVAIVPFTRLRLPGRLGLAPDERGQPLARGPRRHARRAPQGPSSPSAAEPRAPDRF